MQAVGRLERYSKIWPMVISNTFIWNMQSNLEPLLSLLLQPSLTEDNVKDCKKVIFKLQGMEGRNESLPLPIVTLKGKTSKKDDQYKQVWTELEAFIESAAGTSAMHKKVLDCLRGTGAGTVPETRGVEEVSVIKPIEAVGDKVEKSSWSDERYQQQQQQPTSSTDRPSDPRAKKQQAVAEVPSDPRKRRLAASNSAPMLLSQQDTGGVRVIEPPHIPVKDPRKSPRPEERSPTNKRSSIGGSTPTNTARVHAVNMTSMIEAKSSLLSIWSDHMNLTASRLHEEFLGRKMSVNGKFELYQKEEGMEGMISGGDRVNERGGDRNRGINDRGGGGDRYKQDR